MLRELGAVRVLLHDPTGSLQPHTAEELVRALADASGLPVGIYAQGASGSALAVSLAAARAGAQLIACAIYPLALTLHRVSGEALAEALDGTGLSPGVDVDALWEATDLVDEHIGDELVTPLVPRIAVLAARHDLPASVVGGIDHALQSEGAGDRLDEVLEELDRIRAETGWPPLASPIGQVLASQAMINVLSASRYLVVVDEMRGLVTGAFGTPPAPIDPALERVVQLTSDPESEEDVTPPLDEVRERAGGFAASEEELLLLGLFGEDAERLLRGIRGRGRRDDETCRRGGGPRPADPGDRPDRAGVGHRRGHDRGGRDADLGPLDARPPARHRAGDEAPLAVPEPGCQRPAPSAARSCASSRRWSAPSTARRSRDRRRSSRSATSSRRARPSASSRP